MGYRALTAIDVGDGKDGVTHYEPGDAIASVVGWANLEGLIASGRVEEVKGTARSKRIDPEDVDVPGSPVKADDTSEAELHGTVIAEPVPPEAESSTPKRKSATKRKAAARKTTARRAKPRT